MQRVDEMLGDAHLLETSHLRKKLCLSRNKAAVRRDLVRVLNFIRNHSSWARGVTRIGTELLRLPNVLEAVPELLSLVTFSKRSEVPVVALVDERCFLPERRALGVFMRGIPRGWTFRVVRRIPM
jgi:hypothetical protein